MKERVNILMLGGAKRVSLARLLIAAGERRGQEVGIFSSELSPTVPIAAVGKVIEGGRWTDPDIVDRLASVARAEGIDVVLPFVDGAIEVSALLKERLPGVFIPVSDYAVARAMYDKAASARLFESLGFPIPATLDPAGCRFPAILKPRTGSASKGIVVARCADDLRRAGDLSGYLIQEYVEDRDEYTVDCYVSTATGAALCVVPRKRLSVSGGEVDRTVTVRDERLIELSRLVLERVGLLGPVTLQFLRDKSTGRFLLMEINPRLGGGVVCSIRAGADIPGMILAEAAGEEAAPSDDWRDGALMARYFSEVMFYGDKPQ